MWVRIAWFILSILVVACAVSIIWHWPDMPVNNRFVYIVIVGCIGILSGILAFYYHDKLVRNLLLFSIGMSGFAFGLVPLYNVFCAVTGLNGKVDLTVQAAGSSGVDLSREVAVEFVVNNNQNMPWIFKPKHHILTVHPGELASTAYYAKNPTDLTMRGQAIPSISPAKVSKYFKKVECFCFNSQKLGPGEVAYLNLRFYLDKNFPADVKRVTLAYTIFDVTDK